MVFSVTGAIASESVLSFLGLLNIDMSWGLMIYLAQVEGYIFSGITMGQILSLPMIAAGIVFVVLGMRSK